MKKNELEAEVLKYKVTSESLAGQCKVLQQEMMADGTWVDFANLKLQKNDLEANFARSQTAVNAFMRAYLILLSFSLKILWRESKGS